MMAYSKGHDFFIPVMGTGFTIDTPLKVARYGISSVISLVDDTLIEEIRKYYCEKFGEPYTAITKSDPDCRARRITAYLNLIDRTVRKQFEALKNSAFEAGSEITKYFELLPDKSPLKVLYLKMLGIQDAREKKKLQDELRNSITAGSIDVNIMTKLDRTYYDQEGKPLAAEFSDALAALRGYAKSTLHSAIVFSAGINQRLYTYLEEFKDFYADAKGYIKKRIVLKVSDYRSSLIQGKFLAKKGLWVSEFRVESGINCGGHLFMNAGSLLGPILQEFKDKREQLISTLHKIYNQALEIKKQHLFPAPHQVRITAQGGIGTNEEHEFIRNNYQVDATGWGSPFLLAPEVTSVDNETLEKLRAAKEDDIYVSQVSPLCVPFSNLKGNTSDADKMERVQEGRPGTSCPKGHLSCNTEFTEKPICTASRQYQKLKIEELKARNLSEEQYKVEFDKIVVKSCICHQLGNGVRMKYGLTKGIKFPSAVCPGPNLAYFSKIVSLQEMADHIYGKINLITHSNRPHVFIKELKLNIDYFIQEFKDAVGNLSERNVEHYRIFVENIKKSIAYYKNLFNSYSGWIKEQRLKFMAQLEEVESDFQLFLKKNNFLEADISDKKEVVQ